MPIEPRAQPSLQTTVAVERDHIVSHGQCFLRVYKAGRFGGHLERPNLLIPPVPILRSLKGAGLPATLAGHVDHFVVTGSINRKLVPAMRALVSYVENFAHLT